MRLYVNRTVRITLLGNGEELIKKIYGENFTIFLIFRRRTTSRRRIGLDERTHVHEPALHAYKWGTR